MEPARIVHLHRDAPRKPAAGEACNGCGVCCAAEPCPLGIVVSGRRAGGCAALRWDEAARRYRCGLVGERVHARPHARHRRRTIVGKVVARWIAAGRGCDCDIEAQPIGER